MHLSSISLLVPDYDEAIRWFVEVLGFELREDAPLGGGKRWVRVAAPGAQTALLIARATTDEQRAMVGRQGAGRVWLFLETDDFATSHARMLRQGVRFLEDPRHEPYGTVAVFQDPWGNRWDLVQASS